MTARNTTQQEDPRPPTPLVFRDASITDRWLVQPPDEQAAPAEPAVFEGPNACEAALEFAHRVYGSARYFSP